MHASTLPRRHIENSDSIQSPQQHFEALSTVPLYSASTFMRVAASGDLNRLKAILDAGLTVETKAEDQSTVLHCAARAGRIEVVRYLLDVGSSVSVRNHHGRLPIHEAILSDSTEIVQSCLEYMTQEELGSSENKFERCLVRSGNMDIVNACLARLYETDFIHQPARDMLNLAIRAGHESIVTKLLQHPGIDCNDKSGHLYAPIHLAAELGHQKVMEALIACDRVDLNLKSAFSRGALHIAALEGHTASVEQLIQHPSVDINCRDKDEATPLCHAVFNWHWEITSLLLRHSESMRDGHRISSNVSPMSLTFTKQDLLHRLLRHPDFGDPNKLIPGRQSAIIHVAAERGDCDIIKVLLDHPDIDVNVPEQYGPTPLMTAARNGKLEALRLLLQHKNIEINRKRYCGYWTALRYAKYHRHHEIVDLLLSHGAIDYDAKAPSTVPTTAHIDNSQDTTLQPDHETHFDPVDDDMDDAPNEAWEEFLGMEEGMEE